MSLPLLRGTLDILVLKSLSWGPKHGFEIITWLEARSQGSLSVNDGALFQALQRLEARKFISAEWLVTENSRRARYYSLTSAGRAHLRAESGRVTRYAEALVSILGTRSA